MSVDHVWVYSSNEEARRAETEIYYKMANHFGKSKVRGAGHTKST